MLWDFEFTFKHDMSSLSISSLSKTFGTALVLNNLSLEISSGEFFFLLGPSGCGKSTLLRILAGLESADAGSVTINGRVVDAVPPQSRGIGMVFQQYALWPHMTIAQNIRYGLENQPLTNQQRDARVKEVLALVRLETLGNRYPHQISGGQQQRVALARAVAIEPSIILLDEPLSNLDAGLRQEIREELADLHRRLGMTMVYVTHDQDDALSLGDRIALLNNGSIEQVGTPEDLYSFPGSVFSARFLGEANIIPCSVSHTQTDVATLLGIDTLKVRLATSMARKPLTSGQLCLRPERMTIGEPPIGPHITSVPAQVLRRSFRGARYDVTLRVGNDCDVRAFEPVDSSAPRVPVGASTHIYWHRDHSVFLER